MRLRPTRSTMVSSSPSPRRVGRRARRAPIIVMNFAAVPIPDAEAVCRIAATIVTERRRGSAVVAVLPPYEDATEDLAELARAVSSSPSPREHDLLVSSRASMSTALCAMGVHRLGHGAVSLEGPNAGILTDGAHARATVVEIRPQRIVEELRRHGTVVLSSAVGVAQETHETTSLATQGVDLAIALADALGAARCEIVSIVAGGASRAALISGEHRSNVSISAHSIAFAHDHDVRLRVRSLATASLG